MTTLSKLVYRSNTCSIKILISIFTERKKNLGIERESQKTQDNLEILTKNKNSETIASPHFNIFYRVRTITRIT